MKAGHKYFNSKSQARAQDSWGQTV